MPKYRKKEAWKIGKHEFYTAYHYALQYQEWQDRLRTLTDSVGAIQSDGQPHGNGTSNPTEGLAIKRAELEDRMAVIEDVAHEATDDCDWMYVYLLRAVTDDNITYEYLRQIMKIPCGKNYYYDHRWKFYYLLSKKIGILKEGESEPKSMG